MIRGYWGELQEHEVRNNSYGIFLNTIIINKEDLIIMWAYEGVFYQIYPIGFCGAPVHNDGVTVSRILKLKDWAGYLGDLGITSILLNPIFESDNHGYDTVSYTHLTLPTT